MGWLRHGQDKINDLVKVAKEGQKYLTEIRAAGWEVR